MKTAKQREAEFRADLDTLLKNHDAEIDITDDGKGYGAHRGIVIVSMNGSWDGDGEPVAEYAEFQL